MDYTKTLLLIIACSGAQMGCSSDPSSGADDGTLQVTSEAVFATQHFTPPRGLGFPNFLLDRPKIARAPSWNNYEWDNNGTPTNPSPIVSRGGNSQGTLNQGDYELGNLSTPTPASMPFDFSHLKGIGIAQNTSHVFYWYDTHVVSGVSRGSFSEGTSTNFQAYSQQANAWQGPAELSQLIDADVSPNGQVYYYWLINGVVSRSIGTSANGSSVSSLQSVRVLPNNTLFSISFLPAGSIEAWYADGTVIVSSNSLWLDGSTM